MRFILLILASIGFILFSSVWYAGPTGCEYNSTSEFSGMLKDCASGTNGVWVDDFKWDGKEATRALVVKIAKTVLSFGALFAVGAIVFAGIQYNTAYGDDEKIKKAKNTGIYAVIGLLLLVLSFPLVDILMKFIYDVWKNT